MKRTLAFSLIVGLILATPAIAGATEQPPSARRSSAASFYRL